MSNVGAGGAGTQPQYVGEAARGAVSACPAAQRYREQGSPPVVPHLWRADTPISGSSSKAFSLSVSRISGWPFKVLRTPAQNTDPFTSFSERSIEINYSSADMQSTGHPGHLPVKTPWIQP